MLLVQTLWEPWNNSTDQAARGNRVGSSLIVHKSVPCGMFRLRIQVDFICSHLASAEALPGGLFWSNEWSPCFSASYCLVIAGIVTVSSIHQAMQLGFWSSLWKSTLPLWKRQSLLFLSPLVGKAALHEQSEAAAFWGWRRLRLLNIRNQKYRAY